ncbi:MAG: hypothetical protein M1836_005799 [Candelina mexicana]|nr:MAG: hypothetical protein M1836_005799 [Candelina mexicana]
MSSQRSTHQLPFPSRDISTSEDQKLMDDIASKVVFESDLEDAESSEAFHTEDVFYFGGSEDAEIYPTSTAQAGPSNETGTRQEQKEDNDHSRLFPPNFDISLIAVGGIEQQRLHENETVINRSEDRSGSRHLEGLTPEVNATSEEFPVTVQKDTQQVAELKKQLAEERNMRASERQEFGDQRRRFVQTWNNRENTFAAEKEAWARREEQFAAEKEIWAKEKAGAVATWNDVGRIVNAEKADLRSQIATANAQALEASNTLEKMRQEYDAQSKIMVLLPPIADWPNPEQHAPPGHYWALNWTIQPNPSPIGHGMQLAHPASLRLSSVDPGVRPAHSGPTQLPATGSSLHQSYSASRQLLLPDLPQPPEEVPDDEVVQSVEDEALRQDRGKGRALRESSDFTDKEA